jgi:ankyrin repeat protein
MPEYKRYEEKLVHLTSSLWRILENASKDPEAGSIIFVLDALDECKEVDFKDLASHLTALFPSDRQESNKVKFLLTTRPYQEVLSEFRVLVNASPHIRIPGEDDSETIAQEVNEVIKYRVNQLAVEKELSNDIRDHLELKLLNITHRTYLWVYLVFDYLKSKDFKRTKKGIEAAISSLPESIAEAYDRILSRSKDNKMVLKALSIILAARRPLTLSEMNIAINVDSSCTSTEDLDLETNKDFKERLRSWCGLFISIYDENVYFLHQTAREFLLSSLSMPQSLSSAPAPLHWQGSISVEHAESVLAEICIIYLMLLNSPDVPLTEENVIETENINNYGFMMYSAKYWTSHFQEAGISDEPLLSSIFEICDPSSKSYAIWHTMDIFNYFLYERNLTTLMVLAYFKNEVLVKRLLETKESKAELKEKIGINKKTEPSEWTALTWAAAKGNADIVKLLLEDGEVDINLEGNSGLTPLEFAGENGYLAVVEHLLLHAEKFEVNLKDENGPSELFIAIRYGDGDGIEAIVRAMIENGQGDIDSRNLAGRTPLALAAMYGKESIVRTFLDTGKVDVDSRDENGQTALALAAIGGYEDVCQMLLDTGKVDVDSRDVEGRTPLALAAEFGHGALVDILLRTANVDVNSKSVTGVSPLSRAAENGHSAVVTLLINTGKVDINPKDAEGATALSMASANGHEEVMKLLLSAGKSSSVETGGSTQDPNNEPPKQEHDENDNTVNTALSGIAGIHDAESTETTPLQAEIDG